MALNRYMHPRNIYKTPPNFKQLAIDYPEFRKFTQQDITGKVTLDFKDINALHALCTTLLKKDFGLDVHIPVTHIIPTIPLRLNYILWVEDLLNISRYKDTISGVDIGTGATCVYPLIGAKKNGWKMLATEVDPESVRHAQHNVERNSLETLITVKTVANTTILSEALGGDSLFDFCMCNPPFYASIQETNPLYKARRPDRPKPRNAFSATPNEVVADGGEVKFIRRMIEESKILKERVRIYTTMVGHKSNLPVLKQALREADVFSFKQTEFCQGHTTRWGLAWTYIDIDLRTVPEETVALTKKTKPIHYNTPESTLSLSDLALKVTALFDSLKITYNVMRQAKVSVCYSITAASNTWSHQRRKRREQERINAVLMDNNNSNMKLELNDDIQTASALVADLKVHSPKSPKRELGSDGFYKSKRIKISDPVDYVLKALVIITKVNSTFVFELVFEEGSEGKDGLHQILQYIKNNLQL